MNADMNTNQYQNSHSDRDDDALNQPINPNVTFSSLHNDQYRFSDKSAFPNDVFDDSDINDDDETILQVPSLPWSDLLQDTHIETNRKQYWQTVLNATFNPLDSNRYTSFWETKCADLLMIFRIAETPVKLQLKRLRGMVIDICKSTLFE